MRILTLTCISVLVIGIAVGCSQQRATAPAVKENVEQALKQSGMDKINVDQDREKKVVTLKGEVQSDDQKQQAQQLAERAAPGNVIANEIAVRPAGMEETAKDVQSHTDDAIENSFKATIAANRWENQHIRFDAKNGVLTLKGDVDTPAQRTQVEQAASQVPGVQQVVNELEVKGGKAATQSGR